MFTRSKETTDRLTGMAGRRRARGSVAHPEIYRWYGAVRDIDMALLGDRIADVADLRARLRTLEREVAEVHVPLSYAGEQYHLRLHIRLLQERLEALGAQRRVEHAQRRLADRR